MKTQRLLFLFLCLYCGIVSLLAQSLTVTRAFEPIQMSSVLVMYKNQFGKWEKPALDDTFPYAVIRVGLDGNEREVLEAKKKLSLYMGQLTMPLEVYKDNPNEILFLVPARMVNVYMDCGDGCKRTLLLEQYRLQSNTVYYGRVHYELAEEYSEEVVDKEQLKQELLAELASLLQGQNTIFPKETPQPEVAEETPQPEVAEETPLPEVAEETPQPEVAEETPQPEVAEETPLPEVVEETPLPQEVEEKSEPSLQEDTISSLEHNTQVKEEKHHRINTMVLLNAGSSFKSQLWGMGLMFGQLYNGYGWYVKGRSNFQTAPKCVAACDDDFEIDGVEPFYSGNIKVSEVVINAGFAMDFLAKREKKNKNNLFGMYLGAGYGSSLYALETTDNAWISYSPWSKQGVSVDLGLIGSIGGFTLAAGMNTINFQYLEVEASIGWTF